MCSAYLHATLFSSSDPVRVGVQRYILFEQSMEVKQILLSDLHRPLMRKSSFTRRENECKHSNQTSALRRRRNSHVGFASHCFGLQVKLALFFALYCSHIHLLTKRRIFLNQYHIKTWTKSYTTIYPFSLDLSASQIFNLSSCFRKTLAVLYSVFNLL